MYISELPVEHQRRAMLYFRLNRENAEDEVSLASIDRYEERIIVSDDIQRNLSFNTTVFNLKRLPVTMYDLQNVENLITRLNIEDNQNIRIVAEFVEGFNVSLNDTEDWIKGKFTKYKVGRKEIFGVHLTPNISLAYNESATMNEDLWLKIESLPLAIEENPERAISCWSEGILQYMRSEVKAAEANVMTVRGQLLTAQRKYGKLKLMDKLIQAGGKSFIEDAIKRTSQLQEIEGIAINSRYITVTTKPLCSDPTTGDGQIYKPKYIGQWEIAIQADFLMVKARNIASPSKEKQCCHANKYNVCMGGFYDAIGQCLQEFNLEGIVANSIEYLRNFTPTDLSGLSNFKKLPDSTEPPKVPYVFKEWVTLIKHKKGGDE